MQDNQYPPCIIRTSPNASSMPIDIRYLTVTETENLLDNQEELISTPLKIKFDSTVKINSFFFVSLLFNFILFNIEN
jgi:hypothetical protein